MNHRDRETVVAPPAAAMTVDDSLRILWEKVRSAATLIQELKTERQDLRSRLSTAESELSSVRDELIQRELELPRLKSEVNSDGSRGFNSDEKDALKERIRELVSKINSHL